MSQSFLVAIQIASHLAYMVVLPLFVFGGLGLLADRQFNSLPQYLLIGIGVAFGVTTWWMIARFKDIVSKTLRGTN